MIVELALKIYDTMLEKDLKDEEQLYKPREEEGRTSRKKKSDETETWGKTSTKIVIYVPATTGGDLWRCYACKGHLGC